MAGSPAKTLVVFFSRDGHTRRMAHTLAERLRADLEELHAVQSREAAIGYARSALEAVAMLAAAIETPQHQASDYELVVIGSPVWFWNLSSPVRTWLLQADLQHTRVAFFCSMGGSGGWRAFDTMATLAGKKPVATLELTAHEVDAAQSSQLDEFVLRLQGGVQSARRKPVARGARRQPGAAAKPSKGRR
jgi:flavodoxin